ncbi:site-specific integrase [Intestinimonas massiliensis (ex Afouda et al. 2020)]|uniref:site-specific integrase n=1 Tax=Intestinimonas massiliensis (ex Afouda et al. 2020) TaxID=1673721 RepID=UPI00067E843D|nr:site-specific integrase [Intestinimonas massiliensis (ex Afouda et al. 2020)]
MAKKRANGEGNIRKRKDGRWEGRYTAGYDAKTGKRIIKNVLGKTQGEVKEKLKKALEETNGLDVSRAADEYTVASWLRTWYELYAKPNVRNPDRSLELTRPKTENSVRLVSIPQTAVDLLVQEHARHPDNPYMFPSPLTGELYHPDSVVNLHKKILKDAGLPHIRFHDLRHTFATTALQNGVDVKTVSSMLGHFDAGFTLRTYTHATRQKQDEAAQTMGIFMEQVM